MAEDKKSFLMYCDLKHTIDKMPDDKAGMLFKHILAYVNDENPVTDDLIVELTFEPIKQQLRRDLKKYEQVLVSKSKGGVIGNLKRWHEDLHKSYSEGKITLDEAEKIASNRKRSDTDVLQSHPIAKIAVNVNDSVNVNDNDILLKKETKRDLVLRKESIELIYPFESDAFRTAWDEWKEYKKKELKQSYKTTISEGKVLNQLKRESGDSESVAIQMIEQAIVRGWKGIYQIKNENKNGTETRTSSQNDAVEQFKQRLVSSINK